MARGQPTSGTHLITFERVVSLGRFDGHTVSSPGAPATAEAAGGARSAPRDGRRASRGHVLPMVAGITMVIAGLIAVGYGLFGLVITNFITAHEQTNLSAQFADRQASYAAGDFDYLNDPSATPIDPLGDEEYDDEVPVMIVGDDELSGGTTIPGAMAEPLPTRGDALGRIVIPKINVDWAVVSGVRNQDLRKGPGHMTGSPLPGQYGNSVISGHRTTYGGPFSRLDELDPGDRFTVETLIGTHTYEVVSSRIVGPSHTWVVRHREGAWLTLTTCHPKFSSQQRLIVFAKLVAGPNFDAVTDYHGTRYDPPEPPEGTSAVPRYVPPTTTTIPQEASVTASTPTGTAAGDLLLAQVTASGGASATISPPAGWTLVRRDNVGEELAQAIFRRIAGGGEPSSHTFHVAGGGSAAGAITRVSDVDPQNPLWGSRGSTGTGGSLSTSGLTTEGPGTMVVFFGISADTGLSTPGGFTQRFTTASGGIRVLGVVRSVGSGATGGATSGAGAAGPWIAQTVVVRSAPIPEETATTTTTSPSTTTTTTTTTTPPTTTSSTTTLPDNGNGNGNGDDNGNDNGNDNGASDDD